MLLDHKRDCLALLDPHLNEQGTDRGLPGICHRQEEASMEQIRIIQDILISKSRHTPNCQHLQFQTEYWILWKQGDREK